MTVEEFKIELEKHDWWYEMTEDPYVYAEGSANYRKLIKISKLSNEHLDLFDKTKKEKTKI